MYYGFQVKYLMKTNVYPFLLHGNVTTLDRNRGNWLSMLS